MFANKNPYDLRMVEDIASTLGSGNKLTHDGPIYHVKIDERTDTWSVTCLGTECVDSPYKGKYYGRDNLPKTLMDKLVVLNMVEPQNPQVDGVGLRSTPNTFWVYG